MNSLSAQQNPHPLRAGNDATFRVFADSMRDYALLMLDLDGHVVSWNEGARLIAGYDAGEILGQPFSVTYPADAVRAGVPARELAAAAGEGRYQGQAWRRRKDGSLFWADIVITCLRGTDGRPMGFAKVMRDLSDRHRDDEHLRVSEARFRALVETVRDYAIFMLDVNGNVASWNAGAQQILGYRAEEVLGSHFSRFLESGDSRTDRAKRELEIAAAEGRFQEEGLRIRKNGQTFPANVVITALRDQAGQLIGFSKITRDLTERVRHQAAMRASEERFRILVESVVDYAIVTLDDEGSITSWNHGAERISGYSPLQIVGGHFSKLYPPEAVRAGKPWKQLKAARERGRVCDEDWRMRDDGTQFWANNVIARLPQQDGQPHRFYMIMQDLTQRRHAETLADTAQRMHEFIAMLAHELRNPLAPIRNAVALMARRGSDDPLVEAMRLTIDRQSLNLTRIVDELLDVNRIARGQLTVEKTSIDLRDVIARAVETSQPALDAHGHRLHIDIPDRPIDCFGDPLRLTQVVVNILNNACHFTPDGGDVWLSAGHADGRAEIRLRDTGRGLARDSLDRIFDLFMQVDPAAGSALGGLGVGLALVRRILELHGGTVHAVSDGLGKGSEFVVRLPLANRIRQPWIEPQLEPTDFRAFRVLVVDDNQDAANSLGVLLQILGHDVRTVYDGPSAIAMAQEFQPQVALLDIGMPVMNGYDVARALRAEPRPLTIVAVTGWGHEAAKRQARAAGFDHHLVKPVSESALIALLAQVARAYKDNAN
jgi:PAS domain S-box-containing protein